MSTLPGSETWRDAGLDQVDPGGDVPVAPEAIETPAAEPGEYAPEHPLPDAVTEADPADVTEQAQTIPPDEREEYP